MESNRQFESFYTQYADFKVAEAKEETCPFAQQYAAWADELVKKTSQDPTVVSVNQSKLLSSDRFFEYHRSLSKVHRSRMGSRGHKCVFQVFEDSYEKLRAIELSLTPPMLFVPPAPVPPQQSIPGLFLGEVEDKANG